MSFRPLLRGVAASGVLLALVAGAPLASGSHSPAAPHHHGSSERDRAPEDHHRGATCCLLGLTCCVAPQGLAALSADSPGPSAVAEAATAGPPVEGGPYRVLHLLPYPLGPPAGRHAS